MSSWRAALLLILPWALGMRDPFLPPEDTCSVSQLELWHYRGWVKSGDQFFGLTVDPSGQWRRVKQGESIGTNWTVTAIEPQQMVLTLGAQCNPSQWRWIKEGKKNESKDASVVDNADEQRYRQG
ncbi:DUF2531 family protein [Enterobacteriaceae bacterium RIT691]|nr:DUF2531 family protein [Enterobacteriaceae bacterium RIT691]